MYKKTCPMCGGYLESTDDDHYSCDTCSYKECENGGMYEYEDCIGGFHYDGIGINPNGVFCGECTKMSCEDCSNRHTIKKEEYR